MIDDANTDGFARTGLDAGRGFADREAVIAHVAFADDPERFAVHGHVVRTLERAVLAADALVVQVADDSRLRVLIVGIDRAPCQAARIDAMMAGRCDRLLKGTVLSGSVEHSN